MECSTCGFGEMVFRVVDECIGAGENALTVHGLKAHVCPECDEAVFEHASYVRLTGIQANWLKQQKEGEVHRLRQKLNLTQRELAELMGVGTLAAYGRPDDHFHFIEIDPKVLQLAQQYFGFLDSSEAKLDYTIADVRLAGPTRTLGNWG